MDLFTTFGLGYWFAAMGIALVACIVGCAVELHRIRRDGEQGPWL